MTDRHHGRRPATGTVVAGAMLALGLAAAHDSAQASPDPLAAYRWRARVLVVAAPEAGDAHLLAQRAELARAGAGVSERDLVVIEAVGSDARAKDLRDRLGIADGAFRTVLVGKDGGAKLSAAEPIPAARLFATIDAMPMRRDEMRRDETGRASRR